MAHSSYPWYCLIWVSLVFLVYKKQLVGLTSGLEVRDRAMDVTLLLAPPLKCKAELTSVISMKLICYMEFTPINST